MNLRLPIPNLVLPLILMAGLWLGSLSAIAQEVTSPQSEAETSRFSLSDPQLIEFGSGNEVGKAFDCSCLSATDRIEVYRTRGEVPISATLTEDTDFIDSIWLISFAGSDDVQLIVEFEDIGDLHAARVYQDQDDNGTVDYEFNSGVPRVVESGFWSIQVTTLDGFWQRDGRIAENIDMQIDEKMHAAFGSERYFENMSNDGVVDVAIKARGSTANDPRSFDWRNVYTPISESSGIFRTTLMVRELGKEPSFEPQFPWYFLGPESSLVKPYGGSYPPIQFDLDPEEWRLSTISEFVASRGSDVNWFIYSLIRVEPDVTTETNFESPFAFYDLAADYDSVPELEIRMDRVLENDPYYSESNAWRGQPYQLIRYSWDQNNEKSWSYKLGLLGYNEVDDVITFPEFAVQANAYNEFPGWVIGHEWDVVTFVASESELWTTEGIYDLDPGGPIRDTFYAGTGDAPAEFGQSIPKGRRGETSLHLAQQPWLYFSPIDRQLHLESADSGIWQIDDSRTLQYLNSNGGTIFDGWHLRDGGRSVAQLYRVSNGLLYSDDTGTWLLETDISSALFRTLPPTTTEEWRELGNLLSSEQRDFEQGDLRAMFDQFGGTPIQITTSQIQNFTRTGSGFTFLIDAHDQANRDALTDLIGTIPADNIIEVTFADGRWSAVGAIFESPQIEITYNSAGGTGANPLSVRVVNRGSLPITNASLSVTASPRTDNEPGSDSFSFDLDIPGHGEAVFFPEWVPGESGTGEVTATILRTQFDGRDSKLITLGESIETVNVMVSTRVENEPVRLLGWSGTALDRVLIIVGLFLAAGISASVALWRGTNTT